MPYIEKSYRKEFDPSITNLLSVIYHHDNTRRSGFLNYIISKLLTEFFHFHKCYDNANRIMGVLECVKAEFYRVHVAPYEEKSKKKNGGIIDEQ